MINHRSDLSDLYYILFCFQPRQKLRHAKTLKLGETSDGEDDVDNWEGPRLTRSQQREMRNSQARGRGAKGQGRGRGRKSKKEKEVEDIPSDGNEETGNEEQVEDLPEETKEAKKPGKGPKAKASPRKKNATRAKAKAKAKASPKAKAKTKAEPKRRSRAKAKQVLEESGASPSEPATSVAEGKKPKRKARKPAAERAPKKLKDFKTEPVPLEERPALKEFLRCAHASMYFLSVIGLLFIRCYGSMIIRQIFTLCEASQVILEDTFLYSL